MRYAVLSDIHANLEALEATLKDARAAGCERFVCLGDVVGYNANPRECVARIRELECPVVKGNHDEQAALEMPNEEFAEAAEAAITWTRETLNDEEKTWLRDLPLTLQVDEFTIVHASLDAPQQWAYVMNDFDAAASL